MDQALQVQHAREPAGPVAGTVLGIRLALCENIMHSHPMVQNIIVIVVILCWHHYYYHYYYMLLLLLFSISDSPVFGFLVSGLPVSPTYGDRFRSPGSRFRWPVYPSWRLCILHLSAQQRALAPQGGDFRVRTIPPRDTSGTLLDIICVYILVLGLHTFTFTYTQHRFRYEIGISAHLAISFEPDNLGYFLYLIMYPRFKLDEVHCI